MNKPENAQFPFQVMPGVTLRDYFAGQALAGYCAHPINGNKEPEKISVWAYEQADDMLKAREK